MVGDEDKKSRRWLLPSMADYREGVASYPLFFLMSKCALPLIRAARNLSAKSGGGGLFVITHCP